jgi:hypothetical protein
LGRVGRERHGKSISLRVDAELPEAARLVAERLGIELGPNDPYGHPCISGFDASGAYVRVRETGGVIEPSGETRRWHPEPSTVWVQGTTCADEIVAALSGPPFVLVSVDPGPTLEVLRTDAAWRRVLGELREQGWEVCLSGTAAPVALDGSLPTGEYFYLRCRWSVCTLEIDTQEDWMVAEWESEVELEGEFSASYIAPDDAVAVLHRLHERWLNRVQ